MAHIRKIFIFTFTVVIIFLVYIITSQRTIINIADKRGPAYGKQLNSRHTYLYSGDLFEQFNKSEYKQRLPQTLGIGVMKCGTGTLLSFLDVNPYITISPTEIHFFDRDENYWKGLNHYRSLMPFSWPNQITIEKTPAYFYKETPVTRIHAWNPSLKALLIVCNPTKRAISQYTMGYGNKRYNDSFEDKLFIDPTRLILRKQSLYIQAGLYFKQLKRWLQFYKREQVLILDGDQFVKNPVPTLQKVEHFLKIKPFIKQEHFIYNKTKGFFCRKDSYGCMKPSKGRKHPVVNASYLKAIDSFFKPYNKRFYKLAGMEFNWS